MKKTHIRILLTVPKSNNCSKWDVSLFPKTFRDLWDLVDNQKGKSVDGKGADASKYDYV